MAEVPRGGAGALKGIQHRVRKATDAPRRGTDGQSVNGIMPLPSSSDEIALARMK